MIGYNNAWSDADGLHLRHMTQWLDEAGEAEESFPDWIYT